MLSDPFHSFGGGIPFPDAGNLAGLRHFCASWNVQQAYVIARELDDFGPLGLEADGKPVSNSV